MPTLPGHICCHAGCSKKARPGETYCDTCIAKKADETRAYDRDRNANDPVRRLYAAARWYNGTRLTVLKRDPICVVCDFRAATVADHFPMRARDIVAQFGVTEFYNPERSRGVCKSCHDKHTAEEVGFIGSR
jgi:5-methylcytosine-specific restriction endonuclease McrA